MTIGFGFRIGLAGKWSGITLGETVMPILWSYDPKEDSYQLGSITREEMGTLVAAVICGAAVVTSDTLGAEAARRNLINYANKMQDSDFNRLLDVVIAADAHRIQMDRRAIK